MLRYVMPQWLTLVVDVLAWGFFHAATGYAAHRLGHHRLAHDGPLLRQRRFEAGGRWYRRRLRIHRWKDRLPEAGALFDGGISKRELPARGRVAWVVTGGSRVVRGARRAARCGTGCSAGSARRGG